MTAEAREQTPTDLEQEDSAIDVARQQAKDAITPHVVDFLFGETSLQTTIGHLPEAMQAAVIESAIDAAAVFLEGRKTSEQKTVTKWRNLSFTEQVDPIQLRYEQRLISAGVRPQEAITFIPTIMDAGRKLVDGYTAGRFANEAS